MYELQRDITPLFSMKSICQMPCKEILRKRGIKMGECPVRFSSGSQHHEPDLHSKADLREILRIWQRYLIKLCRS